MKKNFVTVFAVVLGMATLASAQAQAPAAGTPAMPMVKPQAPPASGVLPTKIAIINVQQAIMSTGDGRKAATEMQAKFTPRQDTLKKQQSDIQNLQDQMKKGTATMSDEAKSRLAREIDSKTKSLQRDADELNADIETENGRLMQELGGKMQAVWEQYLQQNGYAVLIDVSSQQTPVLWAAAAVDITPEIVKLYDQAHPFSAAAAPAPRPPAPAAPPAKKK